jgi:hypothetical protein
MQTDRQTGRQTDVAKLIGASLQLLGVNVPKNMDALFFSCTPLTVSNPRHLLGSNGFLVRK